MKARSIASVLVTMLLVVLTPAEVGATLRQPVWARKVPTRLASVAATPLGGTVTVGTVGWSVLQVARYSPGGRELWHRRWDPGPSKVTWQPSVAFGPDQRVVTAGSLWGGGCDGWFARVFGPKGSLLWSRRQPCGTPTADVSGIAVTKQMIVLVANRDPNDDPGTLHHDAYVMELSLSGRLIRTFDIEPSSAAWYETVEDVTVGPTGTIFVTGAADLGPWTTDPQVGLPVAPNADPYVMAFTPTGSVRWKAMLHDHGSWHVYGGLSIDHGAGVLAVVADVFYPNGHVRAHRVMRFSTRGQRLWNRTIPTQRGGALWAEVAVGPTGAISMVASHARSKPLVRTFRANGTVAWSARIGPRVPPSGEYDPHDVDVTTAGVFVAGWDYAPLDAEVGWTHQGWIYRFRP
jgi:hypothetical protein